MSEGSGAWKLRGQRWLPWALIGLFWALKTAPIWRHFSSRHYAIRGPLLDTLNMLWLSWWTHFSGASAERSLLFSDLINHPAGGVSAVDYSLAFLHVGLAGLLRGVLGGVAAHNLVGLVGFTFSLVAVYLLLREVSGEGWWSALLACLVIALGLCTSNQLPDLELLFFGYLPMGLLAWLRFVRSGKRGWSIAAVILVGLSAFGQMYYGLSLLGMLAIASLFLYGGLPLMEVDPKVAFRRTALVGGCGFALALLLHSRNIYNAFTAQTLITPELTATVPWPFTLADGLWLVLVCVLPVLAGLALGARRAVLWGLLSLPPALLSLGYQPESDWGGTIEMPLSWVRSMLPFVWRVTFPNRFVTPVLLSMAAASLGLWRVASVPGRGWWTGKPHLLAAVLVLLFWVLGTFAPLVPSDCAPLMSVASGSTGEWLEDYPPPGMPVKALTGAASHEECQDEAAGELPWYALLWPAQPLETVAMPPIPRCLEEISQHSESFAILELSRCDIRGYVGYFHTAHEKAIAGYPCRQYRLAAKYDAPSVLSRFQALYSEDRASSLLNRQDLSELGVGYVVRYDIPGCVLVGRSGAERPGEEYLWTPDDFSLAYGPPVCRDVVSAVYAIPAK